MCWVNDVLADFMPGHFYVAIRYNSAVLNMYLDSSRVWIFSTYVVIQVRSISSYIVGSFTLSLHSTSIFWYLALMNGRCFGYLILYLVWVERVVYSKFILNTCVHKFFAIFISQVFIKFLHYSVYDVISDSSTLPLKSSIIIAESWGGMILSSYGSS